MHLLKGTFTKQKSSLTQVFWEKSHTLEIEFLISFHFEGIKNLCYHFQRFNQMPCNSFKILSEISEISTNKYFES